MKNTKNTLIKWFLGACLLLAGAQSAFALQCDAKIYIKAPSTWDAVYIEAGGMFPKLSVGTSGWYEASASKVGQGTSFRVNSTGTSYPAQWIDRTNYDIANNGSTNADAFTCDDLADGTLYIYEDPTQAGKTVMSTNPPNAKYVYVMIPPDFEDWMSAVPMVSMDGGKTGKALTADPERCGWYYYVWFNETITNDVVFYRDDDADREDMIGLNGNWETGSDATPIPLGMIFDTYEAMGVDTLYFVPDENQLLNPAADDGWYDKYPEGVEGTCSYTMAAVIYDTDAKLHPAFSCYSPGGEGCQQGVTKLGINQTQAVTAVNSCLGVQPGLVEEYLDDTVDQQKRKPKMSANGAKCFINNDLFNMLFNYTQGVNEVSCYDMPFKRSADGKWEFDSDYYNYTDPYGTSGKAGPGGFYPVEFTTNDSVLNALPTQTPVPEARLKRAAEGPVFYGPEFRELDPVEQMPKIDILCNGPGWKKGIDCGKLGMFNTGSDEEMAPAVKHIGAVSVNGQNTCVMGWACADQAPAGWTFYKSGTDNVVARTVAGADYRWSAERNQHYCFESHAQFTHKPGLRFNFRGDDDIWVFIDSKLAVDLGGTHLAAPGYVDLDNFEGKSGKLVNGMQYPLDIFFCDRRTTMSNVRIKTNMYIQQKTAITAKATKDKNNKAATSYEICYTKSGDGSCASALSGSDEAIECCGAEFGTKAGCPEAPSYYLAKGVQLNESAEKLTTGKVNHGGIDLTNPSAPKIDKKKIVLEPGRWTLFIEIDGKTKKVLSWRMAGEVDVVSGDAVAVYLDEDGEKELSRVNYKFQKTAPAGSGNTPSSDAELLPIYVSAIAGEENGKVLMQPDDAATLSYSLDFPSGMKVYRKKSGGALEEVFPSTSNPIGSTGVDTLYGYVPAFMLSSASQTFPVKVAGRTTVANLTFYVPRLAFVDTLYRDAAGEWVFSENIITQDTTKVPNTNLIENRLTGMAYNFFIVALKPTDDGSYDFCTECNFTFTMTGTSAGIDPIDPNLVIENGGASIQIRSTKKYPNDGAAAKINVVFMKDLSEAAYTPIYFDDPPCPIPSFTDVFDVVGAKPLAMQIPEEYFDSLADYQDGIADMVDIYYNRMIPKDSLPLAICIEWESSSATKFYPAKETVTIDGKEFPLSSSLDDKSSYILCNDVIYRDRMDTTNCDQVSYEGDDPVIDSTTGKTIDYCDQRIRVTGLALSSSPKTSGAGKVTSFSAYKNRKNEVVTQGFTSEVMIDRMAPIPVSAVIISKKNGKGEYIGQDNLTITMSEPVKIVSSDKLKVFDFYLTTAKGKDIDQYSSVTDGSKFIVTPQTEPALDDAGLITLVYKTKNADGSEPITPHKDDYLRLSGTMENIFWTDRSDINLGGADSVRAIVRAKNPKDIYTDETYVWNAPTGHHETRRVPTPWVEITGSAQNGLYSHSFAYTGNATNDTASIVVNSYSRFSSGLEILTAENGIPGWFVKADMLSLYNLLSTEKRQELTQNLDKIYFSYKIEVFTNLGAYVAGKSGRVYCDDKTNEAKFHRSFFGESGENKTCLTAGTNRNYYIGWNMISDDGRAVGTGAYISKVETFVKLGGKKDAEQSDTKIWGVKKTEDGVYKEYVPPANGNVGF